MCHEEYLRIMMVMHEIAMPVPKRTNAFMKLKPDSIGAPGIYLGDKLKLVELSNNTWCWSLSRSKYVQEAVRN